MGRLFWKIFLGFWLTLVVAGAGIGYGVHWYSKERFARMDELAAGPRATISMNTVASTLHYGGPGETRDLLREWHGSHVAPVLVVDGEGRELLGRPVPPLALTLARERLGPERTAEGARRVTAPNGSDYILFIPAQFLPHPPPGAREPPLMPWLIGAMVASLLFSAGLAWYLARPVRHLREATRRLAAGALDTRVMPQIGARRDEIADFGRDFDHMADRLQALVGAQKRLLHDVSHELRSPLARLHVAVGLARQQPAAIETTLERVERETQRLDDLVGEVLTLSRLEAGVSGAMEEYFDVVGLLETVTGDAQFEAGAHGARVLFVAENEMLVKGRAELLRRAFENIVRNAVTYTKDRTAVEVSANRHDDTVTVSVRDHGPGVAPDKLEAIFEPFYRAGDDSTRGGYGLGLAIAKRAIAAHGGSLCARNAPGGGLCVDITLPLVAEAESA
jgi:two-component system, OmpR family, sensor kinase